MSPTPSTSRSTSSGRRSALAAVLTVALGISTAVLGSIAGPSAAEPTGGSVTAAPVLRSPAVKKTSAFAEQLEKKYVDPDRIYSTDVRWWLGEASHTDETLLEEIQNLYDGGYRGVELAMQGDNVAPDAIYGYGSPMWAHKWDLMMNKLLDLGMGVYLTSGTNWATSNVPGLDPDSQAAMQNLTLGTSTVPAGQAISVLPTPAAGVQKAAAKFVTAYAYRVVEGDTLDPDSFVDLSKQVTQGGDAWTQNLSWTAPADGTYRVFAMWTQGTYQSSSPAATPSYTTNYFDERGVEALKAFWQTHYLADPALRAKILEGDVQLFMDSLEIHPGGSSEWTAKVATAPQFTFWSEDMAAEFKKRKGYDITPWLFLVKGVQSFSFDAYFDLDDTGNYRIAGQDVKRQQIISDYQDVLTQLYRERMLRPLKEWLNSVGIETRAQISYGKPLEISEPIMDVDYPEAENYNQYNQLDLFRLWTGGAKLENKVLSTETGAQMPVYSATRQADLTDAYTQYAAGFQRIVWHVWGAGFSYGNTAWPGHNPTGFRQLGSRNPTSADYDEFNAHLGRVQQLLQSGKARADVGFIRQQWIHGMSKNAGIGSDNGVMNWNLAHQGISYRSTQLQDNGYTYDYFSPKFLFDDDVHFDTKTKTIEKAGYKAIVLYQDWLDIEGAKRILAWAKQGLKVVVLEDAASRTPFNDGKNGALKKVMDELRTLPTVRQATVYDDIDYFSNAPGGYDDNVMEKLQDLGVRPYTGFSEENLQLLSQTRQDNAGNQYTYVYNFDDGSYHANSLKPSVRNAGTGPHASTDLVKPGTFVPYSIDPWTGAVTELADYRWENGSTIVSIELDYNNIALLAFEKVDADRLHVLSTNADSAFATQDGVAVRTTRSGTVTAALSNGEDVSEQVEVPQPYDIRDWDLTVQKWTPQPRGG
ncbi:glycosyl hydrolase [Nocardioides zeicaulis]|uniref:Glycosyl hydrolase n=1 Tax=Nocardioides zeicaulis TaxID=1776857 RepID=A0ABV6E2M3_9ACTN